MYYEHTEDFELLTDEQIGKLMRAVDSFERHGETGVEFEDPLSKSLYRKMEKVLSENKIKYIEKCKRNGSNAKKDPGKPRELSYQFVSALVKKHSSLSISNHFKMLEKNGADGKPLWSFIDKKTENNFLVK